MWNEEWPYTQITLIVEDNKVIAGCISDFYPECETIEPIYLVVDEKFRNRGLAKKLLDELFNITGVIDMYVEVDNPERVNENNSAIDPETRINIYRKLGFELLDFEYVQPPLGEGLDFERNLLLMYKSKNHSLPKERLISFMTSFYKGLNSLDTPEYFKLIKGIQNN